MGCTFCAIPLMRGRHRSARWPTWWPRFRRSPATASEEVVLVSQDTLAWGGRICPAAVGGPTGDLLPALSETAIPCFASLYLHPACTEDGLRPEARARRARTSTCRSSMPTTGSSRHAARRRRMARSSPRLPRRHPGRDARRPCSSGSATDAAFRDAARVPRRRQTLRPRGQLRPLGRGTAVRAAGCGAGGGRRGARGLQETGSARLGAPERPAGHRPRGVGRRPQRGSGARVGGPDRRPGPGVDGVVYLQDLATSHPAAALA